MQRWGCLPRAGIAAESACTPAHPHPQLHTHARTSISHAPLPRRSPTPTVRVSSRFPEGKCSPPKKNREPDAHPSGACCRVHRERPTPGARARRAGITAPRRTRSPAEGAVGQRAARAAPAPRLPAPPPLRRARGGTGRGVYKARGGRRSFVSCCSNASGSTGSPSSERKLYGLF